MLTLNLDKQWDISNYFTRGSYEEIEYDYFVFSGGEPHIKIKSLGGGDYLKEIVITHRICKYEDVGMLEVAVDALRNLGVKKISLLLPYFPGARMDRIEDQREPFTAKIYARIINAMKFDYVGVYDLHSDVSAALINNVFQYTNHAFIDKVIGMIGRDLALVCPDEGAHKKIHKLSSYVGIADVINCSKLRNTSTGQLSGFHVYADDLKGKDLLIVDDICDGGGTFLGLAKELKEKNCGKIYLAVSHGIFSKNTWALGDVFEEIFFTDSFRRNFTQTRFTELKLKDGLLFKH